ncbi:MAG: hypothetical protein ACMUIG_08650 [Thermoplasmatota archaeon]
MISQDVGRGNEIPVGSGTKEIFLFIMKMLSLMLSFVFGFTFLFLGLMMISSIAEGDPEGMESSLWVLVAIILTVFIMGIIILIPVAVAGLSVSKAVKSGNRSYLTKNRIIVNHQHWTMTPVINNTIPILSISHVRKADEAYWKERWRNTKLSWKIMRLHPMPPNGGLHPMFSTRENLLILFLKEPVRINNMTLGADAPRMGNDIREYWVKEVIIDVDPEFQDLLIKEIKSRKQRIRPDHSFDSYTSK